MWPYIWISSYLTSIFALLAMIVGYHFFGWPAVVAALGATLAFIVVTARRRQDREEREALRRMAEQDELR